MSVKATHPFYNAMLSAWELGRDSYGGEEAIKAQGTRYLPATSGQILDGQGTSPDAIGEKAYQAYKTRAIYPDVYSDAVEAAIGIMHRKPPTIELPSVLEDMRDNATLLGESLELVLRRINTRQLITGRIGLLGDVRDDNGIARAVLLTYNELAVRNWDDSNEQGDDVDLQFLVLDESGFERQADLSWTQVNKFRVLGLVNDAGELDYSGNYAAVELEEDGEVIGAPFEFPLVKNQKLDEIPFAFINAKDLSPAPDLPPLRGLARACLAIYRGEADYRQNLFMQGQDTLVRIGANDDPDKPVRTGAGARIDVPMNGDAKYIGVNSQGLPEQRSALENDYQRAAQKAGQITDATSRSAESGDALRIRVAAQTATLPQIAMAGAAGLQKVLRSLAKWYGADPDEVKVTPNLDFGDANINGQTLLQITQSKVAGAPLSDMSIHNWARDRGLTKMSYEEELEQISNEAPRL